MLCLLIHFPRFLFICLIDLQRCQTLEVFEERVTQSGVNTPVFVQEPLRDLLYCHNRQRDQRNSDQKDHAGLKIYTAEYGKECDRCKKTVKKLRKIFPKICLQLLHAFRTDLHYFRG